MKKAEQLYEGKAKKVFATDDPELVIVSYKDDATALDGLKRGTIAGKGVVNNRMSNFLCSLLEKNGVPTHLVEELNDRETLVKKFRSFPLKSSSETFPPARSQNVTALKKELFFSNRRLNFLIKTMIFTILSSTHITLLHSALQLRKKSKQSKPLLSRLTISSRNTSFRSA